METAFLNCNIWSVSLIDGQPYLSYNFYLVQKIYQYNSLSSGMIYFDSSSIQIPEFEIQEKHLLDNLDYKLINDHCIPILKRVDGDIEYWKIDLTLYENHKLQSTNIQSN